MTLRNRRQEQLFEDYEYLGRRRQPKAEDRDKQMIAIGIVVNPKLNKPLLATAAGQGVEISALDDEYWTDVGEGYYAEDDPATSVTGLVRVHTPSGLTSGYAGKGYGTSLYTALCLGSGKRSDVKRIFGRDRQYSLYSTYDGISSMSGTRSSDADIWWDRAVELGLARAGTHEDTNEDVDLSYEASSCLSGNDYSEGGTITDVTSATGTVETSVEANTYDFETASEHNLIVASFVFEYGSDKQQKLPTVDALWKLVQENPGNVQSVDAEALLALDLRGMDKDAINLIGMLAQQSDLDEESLLNIRIRWELQLDPTEPIRQTRLPFKANSSEARAAHGAVEQARESRESVGWTELAALP
jgi:hypothetical protein